MERQNERKRGSKLLSVPRRKSQNSDTSVLGVSCGNQSKDVGSQRPEKIYKTGYGSVIHTKRQEWRTQHLHGLKPNRARRGREGR
uniref:Uncharacterized protein n=1 Tax=Physcomitrium patens TaxID=3218 RepID=A0A2K1L6I0_PHYPA|nr:hypothetical protein PHYPA_000068 [Physcomitrium patens]